MNWQTIESAPKDRRILLWFPYIFLDGAAAVGEWEDEKRNRHPRPHFTCDLIRLIGLHKMREMRPTHWCEITKPE